MTADNIWLVVGFIGQFMFSCRFFIQWITSERLRRSVIPTAFWHFSIAGSVTLLAYAVHQADPVFMLGQSVGSVIYARNLYLIYREKQASAQI